MLSTFAEHHRRLFPAALAGTLLLAAAHMTLAQGLDDEQAIETIIGSDVVTDEVSVDADTDRIVAAIENTLANAAEVRRKFSLDAVELVFLPELAAEESTAIDEAISEHASEIEDLRVSIESSAMFYHAINSNSILLRDIVALEFDDENGVTIFVAGTAPAQ